MRHLAEKFHITITKTHCIQCIDSLFCILLHAVVFHLLVVFNIMSAACDIRNRATQRAEYTENNRSYYTDNKNGEENNTHKSAETTAATVSVELCEMEKEGLVRREKSDEDARMTLVFLTEEGRRECLLLRELLHAKDRAMMQDISEEEELLLRRLLSRMRNNILNLLEDAPDGVER